MRLTDEERALVESFPVGNVVRLAARYCPFGRRGQGIDDLAQEAWIAVCRAARSWDPEKGVPWGAYATFCAKRAIWKASGAWREFVTSLPLDRDEDGCEELLLIADHRCPHADPALHAWFDPDYTRQRRKLLLRWRIVLYLRVVEGWTDAEIARVWGVGRTAISHVLEKCRRELAGARLRRTA